MSHQGETSRIIFNRTSSSPNSTVIDVTSIDELSKKLKINFDYIKMDIEGAEAEALTGAVRSIRHHHPKFIIASYHIRDGVMTKARVEEFLKKYYPDVQTMSTRQPLTTAGKS
jgi:3-dehydroquinate dehydratase